MMRLPLSLQKTAVTSVTLLSAIENASLRRALKIASTPFVKSGSS